MSGYVDLEIILEDGDRRKVCLTEAALYELHLRLMERFGAAQPQHLQRAANLLNVLVD